MLEAIIICLLIGLIVAFSLGFLLFSQGHFTNGQNKLIINPKFENLRNDVEFVFECECVKYYRFTNELNLPTERAFTAMDVYNELEMKVDSQFLHSHCEAIKTAVNKGKLTDIALLNEVLFRKMESITNVDLLYKLATVLYFSENENPNVYDSTIAENKMKSWKRQKDIDSFFLQLPISDLLPSFNTYDLNLQLYTMLQRKEMLTALTLHLSLLDKEQSNSELVINLKQQILTLQNLLQSEN